MADGLWETDDLKCAVTAPTGLASFNVGGVTIYRIFWLPIEHEGKEAGYWALPYLSALVSIDTNMYCLAEATLFCVDGNQTVKTGS